MSVVAVVGDCTTTTAVAMAAAWPADDHVVILEADRSGGSLAAWLDTPLTPSLSTIVANAHALDTAPSAAWIVIDSMVRRSASGLRFIAAPARAREASRAIGEASTTIFPLFASLAEPTVLADCGRLTPADPLPTPVTLASSIVVIHRQSDASAAAASVRLERLAESIDDLARLGVPIELGVIGNRPFDLDEIRRFVADDDETVTAHALADDALSAAVFAGRTGVSTKRLGRLPLMHSVRQVTDAVQRSLGTAEADGAGWLRQLGSAR
jgi:MinD-like ATPase involved in chromosome partitioning or flagellar assembly